VVTYKQEEVNGECSVSESVNPGRNVGREKVEGFGKKKKQGAKQSGLRTDPTGAVAKQNYTLRAETGYARQGCPSFGWILEGYL